MKKYFIIAALILIAAGIYLNRSYARIYDTIGDAGLVSSDKQHSYVINSAMTSTKQKIYVALGDSLTAGVGTADYAEAFPSLLAQMMADKGYKVTLKNWSLPGARTSDLITELLPGAIADQPDVVTLLIGANDIHGNIPLDQFKKNYEEVLSQLTAKTKAKIYLVSIPYIGSDSLLLPPYNLFFENRTKDFNHVIALLAAEYQVKYVDIFSPTLKLFKTDGPHYAADKFHPSAEGYELWAQIINDNL